MSTAAPLPPAPATITLLLADDRLVVREGLKRIVAECPDMSVVGEAATWDEVVEQTRRSEEHTSELQSRLHLVCRLLLEKKKKCVPGSPSRLSWRVYS